ncbi:MAG: transcriptional regulator, GntR family with sensor domain containing protein [Sporomusa sp.]|jgi:GntR family transcriptional regulator|nr:transcriptional regulator, GntR family with sensor domain containing protein [Sporomusa sp.]
MKKIDKDSPIPLYYQLKDIICAMIEDDELQPDDPIPSERELCEQHDISRMTVNKAITSLVTEGLLYREQGKGTFVARGKEKHPLSSLLGFTEEMQQRGLDVFTRQISFRKKMATKWLQQELLLDKDQEVFEIIRLRYVSGQPFALETAYLPVFLCQELSAGRLEGKSLYAVLSREFGLQMNYAYQTIEPVAVNDYESELLEVKQGALALLFSRRTYLKNNVPMEVTKAIYRGDRYKFEITLRR